MDIQWRTAVRKFRRCYDPVRAVATRWFRPQFMLMKQSEIFRDNADNCLQLAERAEAQPAHNRFLRMANAWTALGRTSRIGSMARSRPFQPAASKAGCVTAVVFVNLRVRLLTERARPIRIIQE